VRGFYETLAWELELLVPEPVFIDVNELAAQQTVFEKDVNGRALATALKDALVSSACMVFIYSPVLFNPHKTWCAVEYLAMSYIEKLRSEKSPLLHSLVVPVVLRGSHDLPAEVISRRYVDFSNYLGSSSVKRRADFQRTILELANYLTGCCAAARAAEEE
jgi:hypothetical protein